MSDSGYTARHSKAEVDICAGSRGAVLAAAAVIMVSVGYDCSGLENAIQCRSASSTRTLREQERKLSREREKLRTLEKSELKWCNSHTTRL
ncbi:unnamed protein product [Parnassius mnemosyne]|uniref:Uncharacterized protein n=1 Tax=Parnassius mnemosyne TaxID=213953 RepID=A0AAV1L3S9_9NEOP